MGPPGGGRNNADPRFINILACLTAVNNVVLNQIFDSILSTYLMPFAKEVQNSSRFDQYNVKSVKF